jgi:hypothetical protein
VIVGHWRQTGYGFVSGVHDNGHHLTRAILIRHLVDGNRRSFPAEVSGHLRRPVAFGFLGGFIGQVDVNVDCYDISCHCLMPPRGISLVIALRRLRFNRALGLASVVEFER